jgi:hypothetical protein
MVIEVYKILHKEMSFIHLHDLIKIKDTKYCFRYDNITEIPSVRTTRYGLKSFRYAAAKLWDEFPNQVKLKSIQSKKAAVRQNSCNVYSRKKY